MDERRSLKGPIIGAATAVVIAMLSQAAVTIYYAGALSETVKDHERRLTLVEAIQRDQMYGRPLPESEIDRK